MITLTMSSSVRTGLGKGAMRRLRSAGKTPAVVYSKGKESLPLEFDSSALFKGLLFIHGRNAVVELKVDGDDKDSRQVLVQEIQKEPVSDQLVHVDFLEIDLQEKREFFVPISFVGVAKGVDMGGEMEVFSSRVRLKGCPLDIPDSIETDITYLDRGEKMLLGDLKLPDNVEMVDSPEFVCVSVV